MYKGVKLSYGVLDIDPDIIWDTHNWGTVKLLDMILKANPSAQGFSIKVLSAARFMTTDDVKTLKEASLSKTVYNLT